MIMKLGSIPNGKRLIEKNERDSGRIHSSKQGGGRAAKGSPRLQFLILSIRLATYSKGNVGKFH